MLQQHWKIKNSQLPVTAERTSASSGSIRQKCPNSVPPMGATVTRGPCSPSLITVSSQRTIKISGTVMQSAVCLFYCVFALLWGQQGEGQQWKWLTLRGPSVSLAYGWHHNQVAQTIGDHSAPHHCDIFNIDDRIIRWSEPIKSIWR